MHTPPFLAWSLAVSCDPRTGLAGDDPSAVERWLRPVRAYGEALRDHRLVAGICLAPNEPVPNAADATAVAASGDRPLGFDAREALTRYGGAAEVSRSCGECPANIGCGGDLSVENLAGCYGELPVPVGDGGLAASFDRYVTNAPARVEIESRFPETSPAWFGLWLDPSLDREATARRARLLERFCGWRDDGADTAGWLSVELLRLVEAARLAADLEIPLIARMLPSGEVSGRQWQVNSHCPTCGADRRMSESACPICRSKASAVPARRRRSRGMRPFLPLADFLDEKRLRQLEIAREWNRHTGRPGRATTTR